MKDYKAAVDAAFQAQTERVAEAKRSREEAEGRKQEFLQSFKHFKNSILMPVFEEFGRYYSRDKHGYRIDLSEDVKQSVDKPPEFWIRFIFTKAHFPSFGHLEQPFFEVRANTNRLVVEFYQRTSTKDPKGDKSFCGEAEVNFIDASVLHSHLVRLLEEILK
ncbi:hypothetical protein IBL38_18775 [Pseudomonas syringae pv. syringae]|uniref:hypothetical protein n=1 Tax=Pseudomonas syringae TaxID=317 RepID=UPI001659C236|nr:hypothetical protein [Pseudomonas syringae]MBC9745027.1 hypothetical protein [Pseudomonas syringae pv. syringae]MBC9749335.1 hypothetical protein [Pseudomonas syringae pv. syringae]MCK9724229.1 hypothetical protein [Pseudomonas syringae pv. syringae]